MEQWYLMRIVGSRRYIKIRAALDALGMRYFQPMRNTVRVIRGKATKMEEPIVGGLFFIYGEEADIQEQCVKSDNQLQFIFPRGKRITDRIVIPEREMEAFIRAVEGTEEHTYLTIEEAYKAVGKKVRLHGGPLDGVEGKLLTDRKKTKTLIIQLPNVMAVSIKVVPAIVEVLE